MNKSHLFNFKKTRFILLLSLFITYILIQIVITESEPNKSILEFKTTLSFLMPGILAMLSIYVSGIAIMIGTLRMDLVKGFSKKYKEKLKTVINTFSYASKTAATLFIMMLVVYLLLSINYTFGNCIFIILTAVFGFILVYTLLFLIQFTVYLVGMIIRVYEISLID